jgi:cytoskeletal protein CcmA (bactofilin family)
MKKIIVVLLFVSFVSVNAQQKLVIEGKVVNGSTTNSIGSVVLTTQQTSRVQAVGITNWPVLKKALLSGIITTVENSEAEAFRNQKLQEEITLRNEKAGLD